MRTPKAALAALTVAAAVGLLIHGPIPQPASYHDFADTRAFGGLPNWQNVLSNVPFLLAGALGASWYARHPRAPASPAWLYVFLGAVGVFFGSAWYHLAPSDSTLVWDRIPIGITFMAYLVALLHEHVDERIGQGWLLALVPLSAASVVYWYVSGDLRAWVLVQGLPIVATPAVLLLSPRRHAGQQYLWIACACYVLAKLAELADAQLYALTSHALSGHAAKHLLAAAGVVCFWRMLATRTEAERAPRLGVAAMR